MIKKIVFCELVFTCPDCETIQQIDVNKIIHKHDYNCSHCESKFWINYPKGEVHHVKQRTDK